MIYICHSNLLNYIPGYKWLGMSIMSVQREGLNSAKLLYYIYFFMLFKASVIKNLWIEKTNGSPRNYIQYGYLYIVIYRINASLIVTSHPYFVSAYGTYLINWGRRQMMVLCYLKIPFCEMRWLLPHITPFTTRLFERN